MKIINEYPPNFDRIKTFFNLQGTEVFAYGDIIYNPTNIKLDTPLIKHEEVHCRQQNEYGIEKWWNRYMLSPDFRLSQEIEAYQVQYKEALKLKGMKDKNKQSEFIHRLATELSGQAYGKIITYQEALHAIKREQPIRFTLK